MFHHPACNSFTVFHLTSDELNKPYLLLPCILCYVDVFISGGFRTCGESESISTFMLGLLFSAGFSVGLDGLLAQVFTSVRQFLGRLTSCETTSLHFPNQPSKFCVSLSPRSGFEPTCNLNNLL